MHHKSPQRKTIIPPLIFLLLVLLSSCNIFADENALEPSENNVPSTPTVALTLAIETANILPTVTPSISPTPTPTATPSPQPFIKPVTVITSDNVSRINQLHERGKGCVTEHLNIKFATLSPNDRNIAIFLGSNLGIDAMQILDVVNCEALSHLIIDTSNEYNGFDLSWHPDGDRLAYNDGQTAVILNLDDLTKIILRPRVYSLLDLCWQSSNSLITVDETETIRVWDTDSQIEVKMLTGPDGRNISGIDNPWDMSLACNNGSKWLATVASLPQKNQVLVWNLASGNRAVKQIENSSVLSSSWSNNDSKLAIGTSEQIEIWNVIDDILSIQINSESSTPYLSWNYDDSLIASANENKIYFWDTSTGELMYKLEVSDDIRRFEWSHDGTFLIILTQSGVVEFWGIPSLGNEPIE